MRRWWARSARRVAVVAKAGGRTRYGASALTMRSERHRSSVCATARIRNFLHVSVLGIAIAIINLGRCCLTFQLDLLGFNRYRSHDFPDYLLYYGILVGVCSWALGWYLKNGWFHCSWRAQPDGAVGLTRSKTSSMLNR